MGIRLPEMVHHAKQIIHRHRYNSSKQPELSSSHHHHHHHRVAPKGHFAVYVGDIEGEKKKRFVVPITYLKHPLFQDLLVKAAEEFGLDHQMGVITIPCPQQDFISLTSYLKSYL